MQKKYFQIMVMAGVAVLFIAGGIYAGTAMPDVIKMENKAYEKHTKGIVTFSHKKHAEEYAKKYPDLFKNGCGECHHDADHKPLTDLKPGDDVQGCFACHNKPGQKPKGKGAPKLSKAEERQYHAEALHDNCKGCHRTFKRKMKSNAAPTTCTKCHPRD